MKDAFTFTGSSDGEAMLHNESCPSDQELNTLVALVIAGQYSEAKALATEMTVSFPLFAFGWIVLGEVCKQKGQSTEACLHMQKAVVLAPGNPDVHFNLGNFLQHLGQFEKAAESYRQALQIKSDFAEAHNNLGIIYQRNGRQEEAESRFLHALQINPDYAEALNNLGNTLRNIGRLNDAEASYRRALHLNSDFLEAYVNLGRILKEMGRLNEAVFCYRRALQIQPNFADVHFNLGVILQETKHLNEAEINYLQALQIRPDFVEAHINLGNTLNELGRLNEAEASYRRALQIKPDYAEAYCNLGATLNELGRLNEAETSYRQGLKIEPDFAEIHSNLGVTLNKLERLNEAEASCLQALQLTSKSADAYCNLGNTLQDQGRLDEAEASYRRAILIDHNLAEAHSNLGNILKDLGRLEEAEVCHRIALQIKPDCADLHSNLAITLLTMGKMIEGWEENEWRWATPYMIKARRDFVRPQWRGEAAEGKALLIHSEQGFGDTLQFCRYASLAAARGLRVIVEVPTPLVRLLRSLPGVSLVVGTGEELPGYDLHCPMLSMPLAFGTTLATIPNTTAYLSAEKLQIEAWKTRLASLPKKGYRIGVVWAGNPHPYLPKAALVDLRRSITLDQLTPLLSLTGFHFFSLQKSSSAAVPTGIPLTDFMDEMNDFADTAALIANLDLVISVDTAVAHLAAALGKPVWLLNRFDSCWRWLRERQGSPWYPTVRIFRQPKYGDWHAVIMNVVNELPLLLEANTDHTGKDPSHDELNSVLLLLAKRHYQEAVSLAKPLTIHFSKHGFSWMLLVSYVFTLYKY